jgi:hypothetical protein
MNVAFSSNLSPKCRLRHIDENAPADGGGMGTWEDTSYVTESPQALGRRAISA